MSVVAAKPPLLYTGAPEPSWLGRFSFPMCVSRARLSRLKRKLPKALGPWILDSSGYNHIRENGRWTFTVEEYVEQVRWWSAEIGNMQWAACMDYMCEDDAIEATGLGRGPDGSSSYKRGVDMHQWLTIENYMRAVELAPEIPWAPVLQGATARQYRRHVSMFVAAGIDLTALPIVGLGSVCRRQTSIPIANLVRQLKVAGISLHGFGIKLDGLAWMGGDFTSVDSTAWSDHARKNHIQIEGHSHQVCNYCPEYAKDWADDLIKRDLVRADLDLFA